MSALLEQLNQDLSSAMKSRDERRLSALRMTISEVKYLQAEKGVSYQLTDEDVQAALRHQIKMRREAAATYESGGAMEQAQRELDEASVLAAYLPAQLSESEVEAMAREVIATVENPSPRDMGRVMGALMPRLGGRADGSMVKDVVSRLLK